MDGVLPDNIKQNRRYKEKAIFVVKYFKSYLKWLELALKTKELQLLKIGALKDTVQLSKNLINAFLSPYFQHAG
jgi:hypothetical protein